jgi:dihydropteroate synthase/2-amino-4-hydroxy-6-hydroxymethyldihydropteridine diphosphokinase
MAEQHTVFIALGTNVGRRAANLRAARAAFSPQVRVVKAAPVYETPPWGFADQSAFYNTVIQGETALTPPDLLEFLKHLERKLGRQPTFRNGPRLIDLDILFYGDQVVQDGRLTIPHPGISERAFVLIPLADLAPDLVHPILHETVTQLLSRLDTSGVQRVMRDLPAFGVRTYLMGILNITPDSFSGDGIYQVGDPLQQAIEQARRFVAAGVDILDVGGESTRPGAEMVSAAEEQQRVIPVISALAAEFCSLERKIWISVDTYKAGVAEAALSAGAHWVNDVWGLRADADLAGVIAQHGAPVVLMHNRLKPGSAQLQERLGGRYVGVQYDNLLGEIQAELLESVRLAHSAGIADEQIILDPGIGFGKTVDQNLDLLNRLGEICNLGYPVLLGPSRKSFIGYTLDLPPTQRVEGTAAAVAIGIAHGADIIRVHDVEFMARLARMTDAIVRRQTQ